MSNIMLIRDRGAYAPYARCMADLLVYDYRFVVYGCAGRDIWSTQVSCRFERYKNWGSQSTSWLRKCRVKKTSTTTSFFTKVRRLSLCLIHHENVLNSGCRSTKYEKERRDFSLPCHEAAPFNRARESRERSKIFHWSSAKTILVYWSPGKASGNRNSVLLVPLFFFHKFAFLNIIEFYILKKTPFSESVCGNVVLICIYYFYYKNRARKQRRVHGVCSSITPLYGPHKLTSNEGPQQGDFALMPPRMSCSPPSMTPARRLRFWQPLRWLAQCFL